MTMTLEQARIEVEKMQASALRAVNATTISGDFAALQRMFGRLNGKLQLVADAIDAYLAQPAQSVDVDAIREVIGDLREWGETDDQLAIAPTSSPPRYRRRVMGKLQQNVADAVERVDYFLAGCAPELADMQTIRAHLVSQEAEIAARTLCINQLSDDLKNAESRLAAANALLREAIGWNWLDDGASRPDVMDVLDQAIQSHLQGAGDEA